MFRFSSPPIAKSTGLKHSYKQFYSKETSMTKDYDNFFQLEIHILFRFSFLETKKYKNSSFFQTETVSFTPRELR